MQDEDDEDFELSDSEDDKPKKAKKDKKGDKPAKAGKKRKDGEVRWWLAPALTLADLSLQRQQQRILRDGGVCRRPRSRDVIARSRSHCVGR